MESQSEQLVFDFDSVQPHIVAGAPDEIKLQLGAFAGPLDLLLFLIRQEQANIFDVPIAKITDEYLRYIRLLKSLDISLAADFLVMAATLIEIKSKMLLPREISEDAGEEIEDPRQELINRLLEHQKYKNASQMLYERGTVEQAVFRRGKIESDENNFETSATAFDLLTVFQKILERRKEEFQMKIEREEMSLAEMLKQIKDKIYRAVELNLTEIFKSLHSRQEFVLAFIAVLELVRTDVIKLVQDKTFGDVILRKV